MSCCLYAVHATGSYNAGLKSTCLAVEACHVWAAGFVVLGNSWWPLDTALVAAHNDTSC